MNETHQAWKVFCISVAAVVAIVVSGVVAIRIIDAVDERPREVEKVVHVQVCDDAYVKAVEQCSTKRYYTSCIKDVNEAFEYGR